MAKPLIVQNGRLTIPLFHGTSSLYYESIQSFGLGGRDVVTDMRIRDAARFFLAHCDPYRHQEDWLLAVRGCENVAADPANDRLTDSWGFNFRYGGTYVSASSETASRYAFGQGVKGGEALNEVLNLAKLVSVHIPAINDNNYVATLIRFSQTLAKPMVVEARDVEVTSLRAEQRGSILEILERMQCASEEESLYDGCVQQENFELTAPVGSNQLRFQIPRRVKEYDEIGCSRELLVLDPFVP